MSLWKKRFSTLPERYFLGTWTTHPTSEYMKTHLTGSIDWEFDLVTLPMFQTLVSGNSLRPPGKGLSSFDVSFVHQTQLRISPVPYFSFSHVVSLFNKLYCPLHVSGNVICQQTIPKDPDCWVYCFPRSRQTIVNKYQTDYRLWRRGDEFHERA